MTKRLAIVVPCYNEEEVFLDTNSILEDLLKELIKKKKIKNNSFILYVDDGSKDKTWSLIFEAHEKSKYVFGLKLAANRGHQYALYAGLMQAKEEADITISIDADLQDDVNVIEKMIDKYYEGAEVVYGVRNDRSSDSAFKRGTANFFYKFMTFMGSNSVENSADFRLMSSLVLNELGQYSETNLYLRGIVPDLGFKQDKVFYQRKPRLKGESKYPLKKMISLAINGITSASVKPLNIIFYIGVLMVVFSIVAIIYSLIRMAGGNTIEGWTSLFVSIWFVGGLILISLGVIGAYVGKTFMEVKNRPRYYIEKYLAHKENGKKN